MLDSIEIETAPNPRWAVLWLHGLGADGHDFEPIVPQLVAPDWPPIRFIFREGENPYKDKKNVLTDRQVAKKQRLIRRVKRAK